MKAQEFHGNTIEYWRANAQENYMTTPISVLKYITILEEQAKSMEKEQTEIISRLKSVRRFDLSHYRDGEFGIDTERSYDSYGNYIDSYEIDGVITDLEKGGSNE